MKITAALQVITVAISLLAPVAMNAQGPGGGGMYSGPNVLSRWSRMGPGGPAGGMSVRGYLHGSYGYIDGLSGPVTNFTPPEGSPAPTQADIPVAGTQNFNGGGGLSLTRVDSRSSLSFGYQANVTHTFGTRADAYGGLNQDLNFNYERQLSRKWGFYTGESAGSQSSILGLVRPTSQRNLFDQAYSSANEALDSRLRFLNAGAGLYYQKSSRLTFSMDSGVFAVSRQSESLVSSRGERAQGEMSYRFNKSQSIGAVYSFSHFYYPSGFGETYVHTVMLAYTRRISRRWSMQASVGPYQAESERLNTVQVDPYIAALTGRSTAIEAFRGVNRGLSVTASISGNYNRSNFQASYRRAVDPGNGLTLTALNDFVQAGYSYQTTRKLSMGVSMFGSKMNPLLTGADRNNRFISYGGGFNASYQINTYIHAMTTLALQNVAYEQIGVNQLRKTATIGLAFSPGALPLSR